MDDTIIKALKAIELLGGNISDDHLTDRTGPNDAANRGLMYCEARRIARAVLAGEDWHDDSTGRKP